MLGLYQAMRREEIASARWDAVDGDWITVVGKGAKTRTIPLHPVIREALAASTRSGPYVFPGRLSGHISPASIWNWVRAVAEEAGVGPVRPHWLRHTALATANDVTKDLRTVQHLAGHARSTTTEGYTRASKSRLQEAVQALDY
jgi:integrase/recombinase XerC